MSAERNCPRRTFKSIRKTVWKTRKKIRKKIRNVFENVLALSGRLKIFHRHFSTKHKKFFTAQNLHKKKVFFFGDQYDWTTGVPDNGNDWRKFRAVPRSYPLCSPCFVLRWIGLETKNVLDYQGRAGDHFHCTVERSPGHIRCRFFHREALQG